MNNELVNDMQKHVDLLSKSDAEYLGNLSKMSFGITKGNLVNLEAIAKKHGICGFGEGKPDLSLRSKIEKKKSKGKDL